MTASRIQVSAAYQKWRKIKDQLARYAIVTGGLGVIVAIGLIFFYLMYVVYPLFVSAEAHELARYQVPEASAGKTLFLISEEQNEVAVRFTDQGKAVFFAVDSGAVLKTESVGVPDGVAITSFTVGSPAQGFVVYGLDNGGVIVVRHRYRITYPNDKRLITPQLKFPLGREALQIDPQGQAIIDIAFRSNESGSTFAARTADQRVLLTNFSKEESLFADDDSFERIDATLDVNAENLAYLLLDKEQRNLYLSTQDGDLSLFNISDKQHPVLVQHTQIMNVGEQLTSLVFLTGELSLLAGDNKGFVSQWSLVRDAMNHYSLQKLRVFKVSELPVMAIAAEQRRKGFMVIDADGVAGVYHSTAERQLLTEKVISAVPELLVIAPRANAFLLEDSEGMIEVWAIDNEHPEVSIKSIWQEVWYESYPQPDYIWQSSSSNNDFEPKYSLTPLVFGTLKAAFYAMLLAVPLAIMGAIYTAYFMAAPLRRVVKPSIEIMEALPTVILGFLAGLWLAPFIEEHLMAVFSITLVLPVAVLLFAFSWQFLPEKLRLKVPEGYDAALLIPVILLATLFAYKISAPLEMLLFNGNIIGWFNNELGIGYDQRNSLVVGIAMGFAVIPTIFSITEDAIFSVPKHLSVGSLALGATPWQTMTRVVILTASPGIFSAVMIGLGRAVGETMIVLMATGNTPVMDLSVFQGMRTLSANIAVEMPESEVGSTHYRVLFLAALVLFSFTFVFNTLAELIRQRLREKYSSL
ncbi:MAG: ABC transporter permease subunit [Gammaproteobacteria bacterium]|jgi:phosphate transport system permease protein|nr:ABC transporter permease subunit [Gammaproteobacteria bacterium]MBT5222787.1 ABC transporter permease subunit [Gammaproteobacteria bacterium]MBT5826968.1 ABC transporter permease subunit [Gammaproteobacteria bacterium]MBT5966396.1 ABC transporter permease subunit [Gammaproteobacteria bacterium]MBT6420419.1 ABC transporter permease subunit [Gammaproteobacteria bacterium]